MSRERIAYRKGVLHIEGVSAEALARRYGTPLYVYSSNTLTDRLGALRTAFSPRKPLFCYALKANPTKGLCRVLARAGAGADVVSGGELLRALKAGFKPEKIVFSGVGKTVEELALALKKRILSINIESTEEAEALSKIARRLKIAAPFAVRLNPNVDAKTHSRITTGLAINKFGVEAREAREIYQRAKGQSWMRAKGIQCHIGSQITDPAPFRRALTAVVRLAKDLQGIGSPVEWVDLGGGIGVVYDDERPMDLAALARTMEDGLKGLSLKLILEPGRYLAADSGVLLTRVLYRKKTSKKKFVVVDAAQNDLARPSLYGAYHPIVPCRKKGGKKRLETVDVVGPICESGDFLAEGRRLPSFEPGEVMAVLKCGAYGSSMSSQYNSRLRAAEILVDGPRAKIIRRREKFADLTRLEE